MFLSGDLQIFCDRDENQVRLRLAGACHYSLAILARHIRVGTKNKENKS